MNPRMVIALLLLTAICLVFTSCSSEKDCWGERDTMIGVGGVQHHSDPPKLRKVF